MDDKAGYASQDEDLCLKWVLSLEPVKRTPNPQQQQSFVHYKVQNADKLKLEKKVSVFLNIVNKWPKTPKSKPIL